MTKKNKIILYSLLLILGLGIFISEVFIFEKPDGILGLIVCIISVLLVIVSIIKLYKTSEKFKNNFLVILDMLFGIK